MNRREFCRSVAIGTASLMLPSATRAERAPAQPKPNIVFILADDWGWGDLSCHGHPFLKTPNLDRLATEGMEFHQFNVLGPVCSPSRTAVLTGQFPARWSIHGAIADPKKNRGEGQADWLDPNAPMLPRLLKEAGYVTGHFGKWHLTGSGVPDAPAPTAYGFDEFKVFTYPRANAKYLDTADNAVAFIRAHNDQPFFMNVWLHQTHLPHLPTPALLAQWKDLPERQRIYAAVVTHGDNEVGQVLAALKEAGVEQNTLVLFSSDNGPEHTGADRRKGQGYGNFFSIGSTGGLRGRKRSLFEGGVRLPFIVRWPGHTPVGKVDKDSVLTAVDLLPTLCAVAGVTVPAECKPDGESFLLAINGQPFERSKPIFWQWRGTDKQPDTWPRLAVRDGDWKLVLAGRRRQLFNEVTDWSEKNNVASSHPDIVARLSKMASDWKATLPRAPSPNCRSQGRAGTDGKEAGEEEE